MTAEEEKIAIAHNTISANAFFAIVYAALKSRREMSVVRMADGEKKLYTDCLKARNEHRDLEEIQTFDEAWRKRYGVNGIAYLHLLQRLKAAAGECTYFAPSVSGLVRKDYDLYYLFGHRDRYVDNFFADSWQEDQKIKLYQEAKEVLLIHANSAPADAFKRRAKELLGVTARHIRLTCWNETEEVIKATCEDSAPLVLFAGGPAGKYIGPRIASALGKANPEQMPRGKVVIDIGHAVDRWTLAETEKKKQTAAKPVVVAVPELPRKALSSGLFNSARFVQEKLGADLTHVHDANSIWREIRDRGSKVVIIEAYWVSPKKFGELAEACPGVKFIVRNHSDLPFLSQESIALDWTLGYLHYENVIMSCNAPKALDEMRALARIAHPDWSELTVNERVVYLPNYYPTDAALPPKKYDWDSPDIHVGCFGAIRPLKNQLLQAVAALKFAEKFRKRLHFHVNGSRVEMSGAAIWKNIVELFAHLPNHQLVPHLWMDHPVFLELLRKMDVVMQVSFSETFNIVGADATLQGVPVVVSKEVPWADGNSVADCTNSDDMVYRLYSALHWPNDNLKKLRAYSENSHRIWNTFLQSLS